PAALAVDGVPVVAWNAELVLMLLYAGIPGTALAYWAMAMAGRSLPAVTTSLGLLAAPVISVVLATVWLGERLTPSLVAAIVLILGGVAIGTTGDAVSPRPAVPAVARVLSLVQICHLHPAEIVFRDLVALGADVDGEEPGGVEPENLLLDLPRERRV